jgi:hypothetical protein
LINRVDPDRPWDDAGDKAGRMGRKCENLSKMHGSTGLRIGLCTSKLDTILMDFALIIPSPAIPYSLLSIPPKITHRLNRLLTMRTAKIADRKFLPT